jgi:hypothetical protein
MKVVHRSVLGMALALVLPACSSLTLENANFEWPDERVITVDQTNRVQERERIVSFDVGALAQEELGDPNALTGTALHLIRNAEGYYFVCGPKFKNVYVFAPGERQLNLHSTIVVSENGLQTPEFNRRAPYVQLLDGPSFSRLLTSKAIVEEAKK